MPLASFAERQRRFGEHQHVDRPGGSHCEREACAQPSAAEDGRGRRRRVRQRRRRAQAAVSDAAPQARAETDMATEVAMENAAVGSTI